MLPTNEAGPGVVEPDWTTAEKPACACLCGSARPRLPVFPGVSITVGEAACPGAFRSGRAVHHPASGAGGGSRCRSEAHVPLSRGLSQPHVPCPPDLCLWWTAHLTPLALQSFAEADRGQVVCGTPRKGREEGGVPPLVAKMQQNHPSARFGVLTVGRSGVIRVCRHPREVVPRPRPGACGRRMVITGLESGRPRSGRRHRRVERGPLQVAGGHVLVVPHVAGSKVSRGSSKGKSCHGGRTP